MKIRYPEIGVCGLSCRLCPMYHIDGESRCGGCKTDARMAVGCPFITCAVKKKGIEFCWDCKENSTCEKWKKHRNQANGMTHSNAIKSLMMIFHLSRRTGLICLKSRRS